jgi:lipopolysaccharide transport system permease protein
MVNAPASVTTPESLVPLKKPAHLLVIRPARGWVSLNLGDVWEYRELLFILTWRDIAVRYKQTALGVAWAVIQPVLAMLVFSIFFGRLAKMPSDGVPYPLFAFAALLPWQLFAKALTDSSGSLLANRNLITKVYFPRLVLPFSAVLAGLVDFAVSFCLLLVMMAYYHCVPTLAVLALPLLLVFAVLTALAVGLWLSALTIRYRDAQYVIPFLTQFWLFATPIAYPISLVPERFRPLAGLNPMTGVVEGFRWALLGRAGGLGVEVWVSVAAVAILLAGGLAYFKRIEKTFADLA